MILIARGCPKQKARVLRTNKKKKRLKKRKKATSKYKTVKLAKGNNQLIKAADL